MRRWSLTTWRATEQILAVVSGIPFVRKRCPCVLPVQFRHLLRHNPLPKSQLGSRRRFPRRRLNGRQLCRACCGQRASSGRRARTETHARMVPACADGVRRGAKITRTAMLVAMPVSFSSRPAGDLLILIKRTAAPGTTLPRLAVASDDGQRRCPRPLRFLLITATARARASYGEIGRRGAVEQGRHDPGRHGERDQPPSLRRMHALPEDREVQSKISGRELRCWPRRRSTEVHAALIRAPRRG